MTAAQEWLYVRAGLLASVGLLVLAVGGWRVQDALTDEPTEFESLVTCLRNEKELVLTRPADPVARTAKLGAIRTSLETNGVTVAFAASRAEADRIMAAYRSVAGELGTRLEMRGHAVYLWDGRPEPTQRQALFDCTPVPRVYPPRE